MTIMANNLTIMAIQQYTVKAINRKLSGNTAITLQCLGLQLQLFYYAIYTVAIAREFYFNKIKQEEAHQLATSETIIRVLRMARSVQSSLLGH